MNLEEKFTYMATGKPYDDSDPLLVDARDRSTAKTNALNAASTMADRGRLFQALVGSAGSVVTHDIPANVIAAGNPCQVLRPITAADKTDFVGHDFI
ncbi:hypothetical protein D8911_00720 [Levilactobacillus brevis]|uniref:maltose acetyltransferase domain-containing protein n=1 Tax=Levilactobacillus yiduensis TaxID=2953880 RepID=UPI000EF2C3F6|nr:maltose acetyltransferase domain-containing protein [Levilactobacillus yiduensis]AYM01582.1 hypothetical protein D8911_00720 [Levilactobacillus brevis]